MMRLVHERCAGLDIGKDSVVACARTEERSEIRTFGCTTRELLSLSDWLKENGCTHVVMEATGIYWRPIWHILEDAFELVLANAVHVKNVPGRKSDVSDAEWLAELLAHGLVRGSFVPPEPIQELRTLTRTRKQLIREVTQHRQRIHKTLEDANIKITGLIADILGASGRDILEALVAGETSPFKLSRLARGVLVQKQDKLREGLRGRVTDHHRFLIKTHLNLIDALHKEIEEVDARIGAALEPFRWAEELLKTMPGISDVMAAVIVAEIGIDMARFGSADHLVSWGGLCPRLDESAGKRRSTRLRHGAPWLKSHLVQAAWSAIKVRGSYLRALYFRLRGRRGAKKAIIAVAASMLRSIYFILARRTPFHELGGEYFDRRSKEATTKRLVRRLIDLGYDVALRELPAPSSIIGVNAMQ
jgi:transposase